MRSYSAVFYEARVSADMGGFPPQHLKMAFDAVRGFSIWLPSWRTDRIEKQAEDSIGRPDSEPKPLDVIAIGNRRAPKAECYLWLDDLIRHGKARCSSSRRAVNCRQTSQDRNKCNSFHPAPSVVAS
jgi:hypothetical protein